METIEKDIEVEAPVSTVYNQWTQFEDFPKFMEGVEEVKQLDDRRLHWKAEIGGKEKEWDAEIFQQIPDHRVAWRSTTGVANSGLVNFEPVGARLEVDLNRFKDFIQLRGREAGAGRGEIQGRETRPPAGPPNAGGTP